MARQSERQVRGTVEWSGGCVSESENVWGVGYCRVGFLNLFL